MIDTSTTNDKIESFFDINSVDELPDAVSLTRYMVIMFSTYDNHYFDMIKKGDTGENIGRLINKLDNFMRNSDASYKIALPCGKIEEVKDQNVLETVVKTHATLKNLHLGYESLNRIKNRTVLQSEKLKEISKKASLTHAFMVNFMTALRQRINDFSNYQVFFTDEEYNSEIPTSNI